MMPVTAAPGPPLPQRLAIGSGAVAVATGSCAQVRRYRTRVTINSTASSAAPPSVTALGRIPAPLADVTAEEHPHLHRVAPALTRLSAEDLFELGMQVILDGIDARLSKRV